MSVPYLVSLWLSIVLVLGCSAEGVGGGKGMDASTGNDATTGVDTGPRADVPRPPPQDVGPPIDAACEMMTPIGTEVIGDPPDMLLTVDISGSMCTPLQLFPPGGATKWAVMKVALKNLTASFDRRINFGLQLYPASGGDGCRPGQVSQPILPMNSPPINAELDTYPDSLFACAFAAGGATPTHTSLDEARTYYGTIPVNPIGRFVLLATDGQPNCGPPTDAGTAETVDETVAAITALNTAGIRTYVLGFGSGIAGDTTTLMRMAVAGGTSRFFTASDAATLSTALDTIAAEVIPPSCTVALDGPVRDASLFQVRFDGGPLIPRNPAHTSGWDYDTGGNTITFYGAECTRLQNGEVANVDSTLR